jgi:hypothetical protein
MCAEDGGRLYAEGNGHRNIPGGPGSESWADRSESKFSAISY